MVVRAEVARLLQEYVRALSAAGFPLLGCVQFGSTVRASIKTETDIDIMLICEPLDSDRFRRSKPFAAFEAALEQQLAQLQARGYWLQLSSILRTKEEALHFSPLYLDMTIYREIHFSKAGFVEDLLRRTAAWISRHGLVRHERGLKWYWAGTPNDDPFLHTQDW